jgi:hypothetical protein
VSRTDATWASRAKDGQRERKGRGQSGSRLRGEAHMFDDGDRPVHTQRNGEVHGSQERGAPARGTGSRGGAHEQERRRAWFACFCGWRRCWRGGHPYRTEACAQRRAAATPCPHQSRRRSGDQQKTRRGRGIPHAVKKKRRHPLRRRRRPPFARREKAHAPHKGMGWPEAWQAPRS